MADLQKDVEALDRVLFRLASVDDERMLQVLQSLLPQLLRLFPRSLVTPLEIQLKDKILQTPELSVFSYNLALLFVELGFGAASTEQQTTVLAAVAKKLSSFSAPQQDTFFRLLVYNPEKDYQGDANVEAVLDFLLDLVLYELPSSTTSDATMYGLMKTRVERLQRVKVSELKREALYERQLDALKLVKEMEIPTKCKIPVYLAGSASVHHAVKAFCDEQLSRVIKYEEEELEDPDVMRRVMTLILGSQVAQSSGAFEGVDVILLANRSRLADASILQALTLLSASKAATNVLPMMLQLLCQLMFGTEASRPPNVANKIKLASVRLCEWTFHHCQLVLLDGLLGPVLFPTLLRLLMNPHAESEASSAEFVREFRQGVYESLSLLAARAPALVAASEQAFQVLLVRCLAEEEQRTGAGANALKAFTSFATAYATAATAEVRSKIHQELVALLNGSKLFDPSKKYMRVQAAIAACVMDGIGLTGTLKNFMRSSATTDASEWSRLKVKALGGLRHVVEWKLKAVHFDDQLSPKLVTLKRVAIENLGRAVSGLPGSGLSSEFDIGEVLVALGNHDSDEEFAIEREIKYCDFNENRGAAIFERVLADYAGSRQPKVRRNATIWLLCMCAAGLASSSAGVSSPFKSWASVLGSPVYSKSLLEVHEFFVTMLNDADEVAKESAVKGLAYLRLRAPTDEMGVQFSDSLFRRLRCFRAFASTPDSADDNGSDPNNEGSSETTTTATASSSSSPSTTVENAAYREVSNVAADVGDPELMYALLYLSTADTIWGSLASSCASVTISPQARSRVFSFVAMDKQFRASIVDKAGSQWMAEDYSNKTKLVPWLFLLKFHSNSKVAAVMGNLWEFAKGNSAAAATAKGEKSLLRQNWTLLFEFALARLENARNFKYREAACLAILDLLNGAEADDVREDFLRLWKTASRAVDDVMEAVALSGVKLYRYLGELSLRVGANDAVCRSQLLEFLIEDGIVSKNTICRALSIDVLLRLVKTLKADDMQDRLAPLVLKLLEYLSSLEMPELQYAQFHVEKKDQLERLRVSISQTGPVGQLLELATARLKELAGSAGCVTVVTELVRGVANLLKFGVGLNTRVGTANFVVTLAGELPFELRKCNGAELLLRRVLIPYVGAKTSAENDQYGDEESRYGGMNGSTSAEGSGSIVGATSGLADGLVIQSYCRAAAYLCPLVDAPTVREYVRSGIFAFNAFSKAASKTASLSSSPQSNSDEEPSSQEEDGSRPKTLQIYTSRFLLISALATKELVKKVPPIADAGTVVSDDLRNTWYCTHVFRAAFIGQFAATAALNSSWTAVLDELPPTVLYASSSLDAVLHAIALLLAHPAWDTRHQAARALQAIFASATYRSKLSPEQIARIWQELLNAVPGRLWKGKGVILESIVALATVKVESTGTNTDDEWMHKLSLLLVDECGRAWKNQDLAYLESAIVNLGKFSALLPAEQNELRASNVCSLRSSFAKWMIQNETESPEASKATLPPLLIKCIFEALARCGLPWHQAKKQQAVPMMRQWKLCCGCARVWIRRTWLPGVSAKPFSRLWQLSWVVPQSIHSPETAAAAS
ncbi:hypothetical protein KRP22_013704 [Phytophthora ramorum]|nr:Proteasome adapter and scaffold protein ECM29 [Phytophthora ramorum]